MSVQLPKLVAFVVVDDEELSPAVREEIWETFHLANDVLSVQKIKNLSEDRAMPPDDATSLFGAFHTALCSS